MNYENQLVLTGTLDDVGSPIRENSGKSYRAGVEIETSNLGLDTELFNQARNSIAFSNEAAAVGGIGVLL